MDANLTREQRKYIYKRDGYRCVVCDSTDGLQIHHFIPRGIGGQTHEENLVTLCWRCHGFAHEVNVYGYKDEDTFMTYFAMLHDAMATYLSELYPDWPKHAYDPWDDEELKQDK